MPDLIQFPFVRKEYPGVGNPRFVSDIVAANQATISAMKAITGLADIDFAIISGMEFTPGTPNGTYAPGIFYLNGLFYYLGASFTEGLYLAPNPTDIMPKPFSDGNSRLTYTLLSGVSTSNPTGATPIFSGNMNAYRIGLKSMKANLVSVQGTIALLGNAAFMNVGTTAGTVASGNDPRFGYTQAQIDSLFALKANVIEKGTATAYTPTNNLDPVNKQYADAAAGVRLLWHGDVFPDGTVNKLGGLPSITVTGAQLGTGHLRMSHNNGSNNFFIGGMGVDITQRFASPRSFEFISVSQFDIYVSDDASANNANIQLQMWQYAF